MFGKTRSNFWLDAAILSAFAVTAITGVLLWLALPEGRGSSSGAWFGLTRRTWTDVHEWAGAIMVGGALVHLALHWKWIKAVAARLSTRTARQARINFSMDAAQFVAFLLAAVSGLAAWLVLPSGGYRGGRNPFYGAIWLGLSRNDWNDVHLYAGIALLALLLAHLALHWKWVAHQLRTRASRLTRRPGARVAGA